MTLDKRSVYLDFGENLKRKEEAEPSKADGDDETETLMINGVRTNSLNTERNAKECYK